VHVVLVEPEIPQNTGSIGRLCVATGSPLHLIEPLGFVIDDRHLRRAGLDYWPHVVLHRHASWESFQLARPPGRLLCFSSHAERRYTDIRFQPSDAPAWACTAASKRATSSCSVPTTRNR
jgi:tRNA (cytidine/uridine-2'-O-)-methyltransferase